MKIGETYTNKQFPRVKVIVTDIGKYSRKADEICFQQIGSEDLCSLSLPDFLRFYEISRAAGTSTSTL